MSNIKRAYLAGVKAAYKEINKEGEKFIQLWEDEKSLKYIRNMLGLPIFQGEFYHEGHIGVVEQQREYGTIKIGYVIFLEGQKDDKTLHRNYDKAVKKLKGYLTKLGFELTVKSWTSNVKGGIRMPEDQHQITTIITVEDFSIEWLDYYRSKNK
jgi:hypothetical protein